MFSRLCAILSYPPTLAHEWTHYLFASLGSDEVQCTVELSDPDSQVCVWTPIDSTPIRVLAFLGPTIVGSLLFGTWVGGGYVDGGIGDLLGIVVLANYTAPSAADVRGALGRQENQTNG